MHGRSPGLRHEERSAHALRCQEARSGWLQHHLRLSRTRCGGGAGLSPSQANRCTTADIHQPDQHPNFLLTLRARCAARPCERRAQRAARSRTWRGSAWRQGWRCRARRCACLRCASRAMAARWSRSRPPAATWPSALQAQVRARRASMLWWTIPCSGVSVTGCMVVLTPKYVALVCQDA